jgi:hypothetical protein
MGGPQSRSGRGGEEKNSQPPPGIEPQNPDRPARSPTLYRPTYHGSYFLHSQPISLRAMLFFYLLEFPSSHFQNTPQFCMHFLFPHAQSVTVS